MHGTVFPVTTPRAVPGVAADAGSIRPTKMAVATNADAPSSQRRLITSSMTPKSLKRFARAKWTSLPQFAGYEWPDDLTDFTTAIA